MKKVRLCVIGDICADVYENDKRTLLGGTAYNVAIAARKASACASIFSAIGTDDIGKRFLKSFGAAGIDISHLSVRQGKTSSIHIRLDQQGKPNYGDWDLNVMKNFHITASDQNFLRTHDAVRAVLFTPIQYLFEEFCSLNLESAVKIGDFAGTSSDSIDVTGIEPYAKYLDIIIKSVEDTSSKPLEMLRSIAARHNCLVLALLGSRGSIVFAKNKTFRQVAQKIETRNTTGAGDTYEAYFIVTYLQTRDIQKAMKVATDAVQVALSR